MDYRGARKKNSQIKAGRKGKKTLSSRVKKIEHFINDSVEKKCQDIVAYSANITNAGYANYPMFQLAQGDANNQREGDKVSLRKGTLHLTLTRGDTSNIVRVLVVATPSATHLTLSDVLEYHSTSANGDLPFNSPYQIKATNNEQTYSVLADRTYQLKSDMSTICAKIPIKIPKRGRSCEFVGTGSVSPNNYNVSLLMISDSTASPHPTASYAMRWKYVDL